MDASRSSRLPTSRRLRRSIAPCTAACALVVAALLVAPGTIATAQVTAQVTAQATAQVTAQVTAQTVLVVGVSDAATGQALQGAQVVFPGLLLSGRTDGLGEARIVGIPVGMHRIRVRFLGYTAADTTLPFQGDTTGIVFRLARAVVTMDAVEVKASGPSRLRDFDARRRLGLGKYLTIDQLEKEGNRDFGNVAMTRFPGLRVVHDGDGRPHIASTRGSCGVGSSPTEVLRVGSRGGGSGGRGAATTGGTPTGVPGSGGSGSSGSTEPPVGSAMAAGSCVPTKSCFVHVYLDDVLLDEADFDIITTWDLAGVEYYSGAQMPARYRTSGSACGVMLLWSK